MERTSFDTDDSKKDGKKASSRAPMPVPLGLTSREGGLRSEPAHEKPKKEDPFAPLRETVMSHVSDFERQNRAAADRAAETPGETDDDDEEDTTVPPPPRVQPAAAAEEPVFIDLEADPLAMPAADASHAGAAEHIPDSTEAVEDVIPLPPRSRPRPSLSHFVARTGGGSQPPRRPPNGSRPPEAAPEPQPQPELPPTEPPYQEVWSRPHPAEMPSPAPSLQSERARNTEYMALRREQAGVFATSVLLSWYLSHRALRRHNKQNQRDFKAVRAENERLSEEHTALTNNFNRYTKDTDAAAAAERRQPAPVRTSEAPSKPTAEQIAALQRQAAELAAERQQPKVHVEQDAWKRYVMVDGKLEKDAIEYGKAFQEERRAEQAAARIGQQDQAAAPGGGVVFAGQPPRIDSGQVDPRFQLPGGASQPLDPQHLLQPPSGPFMEAARNPWMWVGVGILLLAFFLAAFV